MPASFVAAQTAAPSPQGTTALGKVDISTSDHQGNVELDGKSVSTTGSYQGDVAAGNHHLRITREGYEPYDKHFTVDIGAVYSEAVSLRLSGSSQGEGAEQGNAHPFSGVYGGIGLGAMFMPGSMGNTFDRQCDVLGAVCANSSSKGPALFVYGGYSFNPVSFDLFVLGQYDVATPVVSFPGGPSPLEGPKRDEEYTIRRVGGVAAVRVRYTVDGPTFRAHAAIGAGLALRSMFLIRDSHTVGTSPQLESKFVPDAESYASPLITFDLAAHLRVSGSLSIMIGGMATLESTMSGFKATAARKDLYLVDPNNPQVGARPQPTEQYDMARGVQFFIGPYAGLEFGP